LQGLLTPGSLAKVLQTFRNKGKVLAERKHESPVTAAKARNCSALINLHTRPFGTTNIVVGGKRV